MFPKICFFMFHIIVDYTSHKNILNAAFTYVFEPFETLFSFFSAYLLYLLDIFSGWILAGILITSKHGYRCTLVCCSLLSIAQFKKSIYLYSEVLLLNVRRDQVTIQVIAGAGIRTCYVMICTDVSTVSVQCPRHHNVTPPGLYSIT